MTKKTDQNSSSGLSSDLVSNVGQAAKYVLETGKRLRNERIYGYSSDPEGQIANAENLQKIYDDFIGKNATEEALLEALAGKDIVTIAKDDDSQIAGRTPLMILIRENKRFTPAIIALMKVQSLDLNAQDQSGLTALTLAITISAHDIVNILLSDLRTNHMLPTKNGFTPLHQAAFKVDLPQNCLQQLVSSYRDKVDMLNARTADPIEIGRLGSTQPFKATALSIAIKMSHVNMVKLLIDIPGIDYRVSLDDADERTLMNLLDIDETDLDMTKEQKARNFPYSPLGTMFYSRNEIMEMKELVGNKVQSAAQATRKLRN